MVVGVADEIVQRVRAVIARIPAGRVATYGDIAGLVEPSESIEAPTAQLVGQILAEDGADLPWQRVLRANGTCAPHLRDEQLALLLADGVPAVEGRVDLRRFRWEETAAAEPEPQLGLFDL